MRIDAERTGGSARLQLEGRLDREGAELLSDTLEDLLQEGVRSLDIDCAGVTYASSAATRVLTRWHQELTLLRGDVRLSALPPGVREVFDGAGWASGSPPTGAGGGTVADLRQSSWLSRDDFAATGVYELSPGAAGATLTCWPQGEPGNLADGPLGPDDCGVTVLPEAGFGIGVGAIGGSYEECAGRMGELVGVAGCLAYFPSDGARMADYLLGGGPVRPRAVLASGLICEGSFAQLVRFSPRPDAEAIPFSELARVALDAVGGRLAGLVIVGEAAGLCGARLRRSPAGGGESLRFDVPAVREWLSFAPERIHPSTTTLIAAVVARSPTGAIAAHLRPLSDGERLFGHCHAAVFSYHPIPQRTVDLDALVRGLFTNHQLRDVLHLLWDDRAEGAVAETTLVRGVGWIAPITQAG